MALLEIEDLRVEYRTLRGAVTALPGFSLTIGEGESVGLVGESGCGKTTLLMAMLRHLGPAGVITGGAIRFEGRDLAHASEADLAKVRGSRIAIVYQEPASALNPTMTIGAQLAEVPMQHQRLPRAAALARAAEVLADVHMPDPRAALSRYPHQLSGGQKQRVVIAMALLANPALLLLDEPTTGLDVTVEAAVIDLIGELRAKYRTALLYISHNLGLIARVADRVGVMYAGELVEEATAVEIFAAPRHPYTRGLLAAIPRPGASKETAALLPIPGTVPSLAHRPPGCGFAPRCAHFSPGLCDAGPVAMAGTEGHRVRCLRWAEVTAAPAPPSFHRAAPPTAALLESRDLCKIYRLPAGALKANDGLDFAALKGEVLAIVGESGSGKSTFARILTGLETATSGSLRFAGAEIANRTVHRRGAGEVAAIQMVFQNPDGTLNPSHAVGWALGRAVRKLGGLRDRAKIAARVEELLALVRLPASARHSRPRQLSGGQKQRIAIARAFAGQPEILVADEPVSALDVSVQAAVVNLLLAIQAERGSTMVLISHDLGLVRYLADHVVVMYLGRVMEAGPSAAIFAPPYHPYTEALLSAAPLPDPTRKPRRIRLEGEIPSPLNPPAGCRFASRCPRKLGTVCELTPPPLRETADGHLIFCHIPLERLRAVTPVFAPEMVEP